MAITTETRTYPIAGQAFIIQRDDLNVLINTLDANGFTILGPTIGNSAVTVDRISSINDLPAGWTDEQDGGLYRLKRRNDTAVFGHGVGPHSWKQFLFPSERTILTAQGHNQEFKTSEQTQNIPQYAFFGVTPCDLYAIQVQDRTFVEGPYVDPYYKAVRDKAFIVAVNCTQGGGTCFCVSMGTGPKATSSFDLALTELLDQNRHSFLAEVGSGRGLAILEALPHRQAEPHEKSAAEEKLSQAAAQMGRFLDTSHIKPLLYGNYEHPRWENVAARCLTCGNCTLVCPTCFCSTTVDITDLSGTHASRVLRWDSCFTLDHTYIHGGNIRTSSKSRYRQWLTHKLATWIDQFGTSGCVGCGRCITWCPVGIDITEEVAAIRGSAVATKRAEDYRPILEGFTFFQGISPKHLSIIIKNASMRDYSAGEMVFRQGQAVKDFLLIQHGRISLEIASPNRGPIPIQTLTDGDALGWTWIVAPYRHRFDARAIEPTRVLAFTADRLRDELELEPELGYILLRRFTEVMASRLEATRLQLLDLYD